MNAVNIGTRDIPLKLAQAITKLAQHSFENGEMLSKVTPVTADLLKFWFLPPYTDNRHINFHEGQRQSIINTIYLHEIVGIRTVKDVYLHSSPDLLAEMHATELAKEKYNIPKYAMKMATGTGKTWVMHSLLIWQLLNARYESERTGKFTSNFLLVAPGLIVYERLLDAYLGKENEAKERIFEDSDFYKYQSLFIPPAYKEDVFGFIQTNVAKKEEIGSKVTGGGLIAITNWHLFMGDDVEDESSTLDDTESVVKDLLPIRPGTSGGNDLGTLDNKYLRGAELDYLASLESIMVVNDEAHHIHENKSYGEAEEVEWQKGLNKVAEKKGSSFIQVDFSATPYDVTGSGQTRTKHYFPHIISDFDLATAIRKGLVKTIAIDKRKEIADLGELDYSAIRDENKKVLGLSEGQKLMLRAGMRKLNILEEHFTSFTKDSAGNSNKYPKMLVVCEDTNVSPFVEEFLVSEGLSNDDITRVDSNRSGEIPKAEWQIVKQKLFNIDKYAQPRVIVSVLMLREGFDVSNICVIVPLRASNAPILLEQTIGRGLRLMWREEVFKDIKAESRKNLLELKREPTTYLDLLTIIEHPAFVQFYDDLLAEGLVGEVDNDPDNSQGVMGDLITVGLKASYQDYDLFWPVIVHEAEEILDGRMVNSSELQPFTAFDISDLQKFLAVEGEQFYSEEMTVKTRFGDYMVNAALFTSESYNEHLQKLLHTITNRYARVGKRTVKLPMLQVGERQIIALADEYIKTNLFGQPFDPFAGANWKILLAKNGLVTNHLVQQLAKCIYEMQSVSSVDEPLVEKYWLSSVPELKMRERYALDITKTIYERLAYPSNKGLFEKAFMLFTDRDSEVESFIKINEHLHSFAAIAYIRNDGLLSVYHPDFIVKTAKKIYIIETKGNDKINDDNVRQKQLSTVEWCTKTNRLPLMDRMDRQWEYVLLSENHFYGYSENGASLIEICELAKVSETAIKGQLFA
ncbi:DEAD/DEAH box helicase family protein [Nemorincola caseinilytica]|uniref:DEAD/DEAH box helicase family protein n=1 Tax=Nemorincola caseinilytica TaxID=2054315 RepID=A0ABP8NAC0_9BACT